MTRTNRRQFLQGAAACAAPLFVPASVLGLARSAARDEKADPFVTNIRVAGPYMLNRRRHVPPEAPEKSTDVSWGRTRVDRTGRIYLLAAGSGAPGVTFVTASIEAPEALTTRLLLGSEADLEVWLNGRRVYAGRPGPSPSTPDQAAADVELQKGRNVLLVKASYSGDPSLYLRFRDPDRKLRYPKPGE